MRLGMEGAASNLFHTGHQLPTNRFKTWTTPLHRCARRGPWRRRS